MLVAGCSMLDSGRWSRAEDRGIGHVREGCSAQGARTARIVAMLAVERIATRVGRIRRAALDLVFPFACAGCDTELSSGADERSQFCGSCLGQIQFHAGATCRRCAAMVPAIIRERSSCFLCRGTKLWFDEAVALAAYEGLLREWLLEAKHRRGERRSLALAELLWERCGERIAAMRPASSI